MQNADKSTNLLLDESKAHAHDVSSMKEQILEKDRFIEKLQNAFNELRQQSETVKTELNASQRESKSPSGPSKPGPSVKATKTTPNKPESSPSIKSPKSPSTKESDEPEKESEETNSTPKKLLFKPQKGDEIDVLLAKMLVECGLQSLPITRIASGNYEIVEAKGINGKKYSMKIVNSALMIRPGGGSYIKFDVWAKSFKK